MLYSTGIAYNLTSGRLKGSYTVDEARPILLGDAPVQAVTANGGAISLKPKKPPASPDSKAPADPSTLPKVTVTDQGISDSDDPYNTDYNRPNATAATKTDTPIMETPVSIQVVPKQVLQDQQAYRIQDALRNVSGVQQRFSTGGHDSFVVRGFELGENQYRNGVTH